MGLASRRQRSLISAHLLLKHQIGKIRELRSRLQERVIRDPLSRLYNKRYLDETLPRDLASAKREGYSLAIIMIGLDHLKLMNGTYGHAGNDDALKAFATILSDGAMEIDILCR
jgi:diguanylate cyclase (GGDEF)-like protein